MKEPSETRKIRFDAESYACEGCPDIEDWEIVCNIGEKEPILISKGDYSSERAWHLAEGLDDLTSEELIALRDVLIKAFPIGDKK
jgi:hypothetical protein